MLKYQWTDGTTPHRSSRHHAKHKESLGENVVSRDINHSNEHSTPPLVVPSTENTPSNPDKRTNTNTPPQSSISIHDSMGTRSVEASSREDICMMMAERSSISQGGQNPFFNNQAYMSSMMEYYPSQISPYKA